MSSPPHEHSAWPRWSQLSAWLSRLPRLPHWKLNFIYVHYIVILSFTLAGSVVIFGDRSTGLSYIDSLFFASGSATQSGLNTVDVNLIALYQQIILWLISCLANPIVINTIVVLVRLHFFEKRFNDIALEASSLRRTRTRERSRTSLQSSDDRAVELAEQGNNRKSLQPGQPSREASDLPVSSSSDDDAKDKNGRPTTPNSHFQRTITFADEAPPSPVMHHRSMNEHIAFVENQRHASTNDDETLYIPGPRDFDRGEGPRNLHRPGGLGSSLSPPQSPQIHAVSKTHTNESGEHRKSLNGDGQAESNSDAHSFWHRTRSVARSSGIHNPFRHQKEDDRENDTSTINKRSRTLASVLTTDSRAKDMPYLSYEPTVGRNSAFIDLTKEQRKELGGLEYRSLKTLRNILFGYYFGFHVFGVLSLLPWIARAGPQYQAILDQSAINKYWWSVFTSGSMFTDLGFTLTPDSMNSFNFAVWPLIVGGFLIVIGNTGFPCMLRFLIWTISICTPRDTPLSEELRFLLDHPRRCFTLLFPAKETWWLFGVLIVLNGLDLLFFCVLDIGDGPVGSLPAGIQVLDGAFQAVSTRTAGFSVINISSLHPAVQVSYLIMMYISVFPIAISVRRTNVYEEQSLGVYTSRDLNDDQAQRNWIGTHLRHQLSHDLGFVAISLFIVAIVEGPRLSTDPSLSLFTVLFEIVSAYGTVGLSLGYPGTNASLSAQLHTLSKLVIIGMQIRGRHRGLPYALDRAVILPGDKVARAAEESANRRHRESMSAIDGISVAGDLPNLPRTPVHGRRSSTGQKSIRHPNDPHMPGLMRSATTGTRNETGIKRRVTNAAGDFFANVLIPGPTIPRDTKLD